MSQYQRKIKAGVRWYYKFDYKGKVYFSKCKYLTKAEAKKAEAIRLSLLNDGENLSKKTDLLLSELIKERLDYITKRKTYKYTKESRYYLSLFLSELGDVSVDKISKKQILDLISSYEIKGKYAANAYMRCLKALFNFGINFLELEIDNPCKNIPLFSIDKKIKYIPSDKEIEQVLNSCDQGQRLLIRFVMETGARVGECFRITGKDILENYVVLYTHKSLNSDYRPRKVPKPLCLKDIRLKPDEFLFPEWKEQPKFLSRKISLLNQRHWNWHNLRNRYASLLSKSGKPIFEISQLLGHSSITTTQIYLQLLP